MIASVRFAGPGPMWGTPVAYAILLTACGGSSGGPSAPATHAIGVIVSGCDLPIMTNGIAMFAGGLAPGAAYAITVRKQPAFPIQACSVTNSSGTIGSGDVNDVAVTCATSITTLYSFTGVTGGTGTIDGAVPNGSLVQGPDGSLYGTTSGGGADIYGRDTFGFGTAFKISLSGREMVLHSFGALDGDASAPATGLIIGSDGNFYGTTPYITNGITPASYRIDPAGAESVIHIASCFPGLDDYSMLGNVIQGNDGLLYGAVYEYPDVGEPRYEIYGMTTAGATVFTADIGPNLSLYTNLVQTGDGRIFGTTNIAGTYGMGTVFEVKPDIKTIYSFGDFTGDASAPRSPMIEGGDGNLYGTSATGGGPSATCPKGCGTVFRVTSAGVVMVLYSFGSSPADGQGPSGALIEGSDGNFYGVTAAGGAPASSGNTNPSCARVDPQTGDRGCGTIYKITPAGVTTVLYSFGSSPAEGTAPAGALLQASDGNLYGTTAAGGAANKGTVFELLFGAG